MHKSQALVDARPAAHAIAAPEVDTPVAQALIRAPDVDHRRGKRNENMAQIPDAAAPTAD
jgi:hypothetical protein